MFIFFKINGINVLAHCFDLQDCKLGWHLMQGLVLNFIQSSSNAFSNLN